MMMEYAAALAGLVVVTANPALQENELGYIVEQSEAVTVFLVPDFRGNAMLDIATSSLSEMGKFVK